MTTPYNHDFSKIIVQNLIVSEDNITFRLPKGSSQQKLTKITKKINAKWQFDCNIIWKFQIYDKLLSPTDVNTFEQVLSVTPPPLTIQIVKVMNHKYTQIYTIK